MLSAKNKRLFSPLNCIDNNEKLFEAQSKVRTLVLPLSINATIKSQKQKSQILKSKLSSKNSSRYSSSKLFPQYVERYNLLRSYKIEFGLSQIEEIDKVIYNDYGHLVSIFKDYLIYDDLH